MIDKVGLELLEYLGLICLDLASEMRLLEALRKRDNPMFVPERKIREVTPDDHKLIKKACKEVEDERLWLLTVRDAVCAQLGLTPEQVRGVLSVQTRRKNGKAKKMACGKVASSQKPETASVDEKPKDGQSQPKQHSQVCSACGKAGHNKLTCGKDKAAKTKKKTAKPPKGQKKSPAKPRSQVCSVCGQSGHNKLTCGQKKKAEPAPTKQQPAKPKTKKKTAKPAPTKQQPEVRIINPGLDPTSWEKREAKRGAKDRLPKSVEYAVDDMDKAIVVKVRRAVSEGKLEEGSWPQLLHSIGLIRRLTLQQMRGIVAAAVRRGELPPIH